MAMSYNPYCTKYEDEEVLDCIIIYRVIREYCMSLLLDSLVSDEEHIVELKHNLYLIFVYETLLG